MKENNNKSIAVLVLIIIAAFVLPWRNIDWGKIRLQDETVVVIGESEVKQKNEVASFSAGINAINENKEEAIDGVNKKVKELTDSIKNFGIADEDVQTQSINVYEQQETDKLKKNKWIVNNTIEITLKDVSKVNEFVDLLNKSGANNVYGPSFRIENTNETEKTLYESAVNDAKERAELIAKASGRKLGKIINVVEGSNVNYSPMYKALSSAGDGGAELAVGTSTISKILTVTFELK